jgi:hypothetical protein
MVGLSCRRLGGLTYPLTSYPHEADESITLHIF